MEYALLAAPADADRIAAVWIHAGTVAAPGAARLQLIGPGRPAEGRVTLSARDRQDLARGRLLVRFFLHDAAGSAADVPLAFERRTTGVDGR
jgi:hypothetical protein